MESEKQPLLSFAIPTYNFGKFIAETVRTIEDGAQVLLPSQFEIVILDGGSADNTDDIVRKLANQYGNIRYVKQTERGGIDRDMNAVAEMAKGKYIWLFSADDLLECGWDRCIVPLMEKGGDVFLIPATLCDIQMAPLRENPIFQDCTKQKPIEFNITPEDDSLIAYLNRAATLEALFSYMSSVAVNASVWRGLPARADYYGSCWAHCARLMPLLFNKSKIIYLNYYLIKKRGGNDSFMANGFIARIAITVDGWDKIIGEFFVKASHKQLLYNALRKSMPIILFIYAKIASHNTYETDRLNKMARLLYTAHNPSLSTKIKYLIYRVIPASPVLDEMIKPLLPLLKRIRHKMESLFV
jgi:abequosyltransferase